MVEVDQRGRGVGTVMTVQKVQPQSANVDEDREHLPWKTRTAFRTEGQPDRQGWQWYEGRLHAEIVRGTGAGDTGHDHGLYIPGYRGRRSSRCSLAAKAMDDLHGLAGFRRQDLRATVT